MIKENLAKLNENNRKSCEKAGRNPKEVTLIAVSKTKPVPMLEEAYQAGSREFGENKAQEIMDKYPALPADIHWHMIGHLQRNKVKDVVPLVDMIQSLDSLRLAEEIEKQCAKIEKVMPVLVEVNIAREANKTGILLEECLSFVKQCMSFPHLDVQGLMCVGPMNGTTADIEACFEKMQVLYHTLQNEYGAERIRYLSMGMSQDYALALKHGSNMIRLGTIIFGQRNYNK